MRRIIPWLLVSGVLLMIAACGAARHDMPSYGAMPFASAEAARGEIVFNRVCSQCHPRGEAGLAPAINDKPLPAFLMRFQVRNGLGAMPAFSREELSEEDLDAIIAYLQEMRQRG